DAAGNLLLRKGLAFERNEHLESLIQNGVFVRVQEFKDYQTLLQETTGAPAPASASAAVSPPRVDPFRLRETIGGSLLLLMRHPTQESDFVTKVRELAEQVQFLCENNPDAALAAIMLSDHSKYAIAHSLDTAVLTELLGRKLDWSDAQRQSAVCAALTMNIGMLDAQTILALQKMPPTEVQRAGIADHPRAGVALLGAAGVDDKNWLRIVQDHHEIPDGSGYPGGIKVADQDTLLVRILDIFCAIVTPRASRKASDTAQAARALFVQENKYNNSLPGLLIKEIGLYPPGTFVKLKNGDTAVISKRATASTPILVHSFLNSSGIPMLEPMWRDTARAEFAIASAIANDTIHTAVNFEKLWTAKTRT
ncbi:MAG TPA: HD domain-containing phosphohydrolase, partial [Rhodocyclaceae bacterium]|nr:HD domain-containing phosphohydrolase [Rhodocyclaceae bacterium]